MFFLLGFVWLLSLPVVTRADLPPGLPFDEHELAEALSARVPALSPADLRLEQVDGRVLVTLGDRARVVELGEAEHAEAARVLALVVADMAHQEAAPAARRPPAQPSPAVLPAAPTPAPRDRARLGVDGAVQRGLQSEEPWSFDLGLGAHARVWRKLVLGARLGYWTSPTVRSQATGTAVRFDGLTLRAAVGLRLEPFELVAGPMFAQYWVRGGQGHHDQLAGASAQLTLWLPVVSWLRLAARLCFDVLGNRTRLYAGSDRVLTTPRTMLGLALGFAWGWS